MAKSSGPAAPGDTTPGEQPPAEPATAAPVNEPETLVSFWLYTGTEQRVYPHIPVTVEAGDVIAWVGVPAADGRWEQHDGPATRDPDNAPRPAPVERADHATAQE